MRNRQLSLLGDWSAWKRSLFQTILVVGICIIVVGSYFAPVEYSKLQQGRWRGDHCARSSYDGAILVLATTLEVPPHIPSRGNEVLVLDVANKKCVKIAGCFDVAPILIAADRPRPRFFVSGVSGDLVMFEGPPDNCQRFDVGRTIKGIATKIECSSDGNTLIAQDRFGLCAWNVDRVEQGFGEPRWRITDSSISSFAIAPDRSRFFCSRSRNDKSEIGVYDTLTGQMLSSVHSCEGYFNRMTIDPSGRNLAWVYGSGQIGLLRRSDSLYQWVAQDFHGLDSVRTRFLAFSPNGQRLAAFDEVLQSLVVWELSTGEQFANFQSQTTWKLGCEFVSNERLLTWSLDGKLELWELTSEVPVEHFELEQCLQ